MLEDIPVMILRKNIRRINIRCDVSARIICSAPLNTPDHRIFQMIESNRDWIKTARKRSLERIEEKNAVSVPPTLEEWKGFEPILKEMVERRSHEMHLYPADITIRHMKTRWGSCRKDTRHITFNSALCKVPEECADYVVVHELAHLRHADHSADFWRMVERFCPEWQRLRNRLKHF